MPNLQNLSCIVALLLAGGMMAGCPPGDNAKTANTATTPPAGTANTSKGSMVGKYVNKHDNITVEIKPDGKAVMTDEGKSTETKYDMDGPDKVIVYGTEGIRFAFTRNADGNLSMQGFDTVFIKE